jgi:tetratricopeptide (TPR) repeat protein
MSGSATVGVGKHMESARRQTLWYLLRSDTGDARRARQRLAVGTCLALFLAGLLAAVGLAIVVVAACVLFAGAVAVAATGRALRQHHDRLSAAARSFASDMRRAVAPRASRARQHARRVPGLLAETASDLQRTVAPHATRAREQAQRLPGVLAQTADRAATGVRQIQLSPPRPIDLKRQALRLNAEGTNCRRRGAYAEAVDLHTRALLLLRDVDDPHALALTQNNLALALSHVGDDRESISLFELAAATLDALGDKENEGKIMANLALAHRRHGRADESENVLRLALTKLERDSSAYELVEAQLRRAS